MELWKLLDTPLREQKSFHHMIHQGSLTSAPGRLSLEAMEQVSRVFSVYSLNRGELIAVFGNYFLQWCWTTDCFSWIISLYVNLKIHIYMYVCIYVLSWIYIWNQQLSCVFIHPYAYTFVYLYMHSFIHIHVQCTCTHIYRKAYRHRCKHVYRHIHTYIDVYIFDPIHPNTHVNVHVIFVYE